MLILSAVFIVIASLVYFYRDEGRNLALLEKLKLPHFSSKANLANKYRSSVESRGDTGVADLRNVLPPSRREFLNDALKSQKKISIPQDEKKSYQTQFKQLPMTQVHHDLDGDFITPTGFSLDEIRRLGRFPDYSKISGVPLPEEYRDFNFDRAVPRPYRPFRWQYFQTMSLSKLETNWWLEITKDYRSKIAQRVATFAQAGPQVLQALPGSEYQCQELSEHVVQFLCARHPTLFQLSDDSTTFRNRLLNTTTHLPSTPPLHLILHTVADDFAIMLRDPSTGLHHFRAGIICHAQGWTLATKIGKPLHAIHAPVAHYARKMAPSMDRYFARLPTHAPIQRGSWAFELDEPMFMPPGDAREAFHACQMDPARLVPHGGPPPADAAAADAADAETNGTGTADPPPPLPPPPSHRVNLRVEWQTLRRLPLTGAVVFGFRGIYTPLAALRREPYIPRLVLKILEEGEASLMAYKKVWHVEHVVKPWMAAWAAEQEEGGVVPVGWEEATLAEAPFFPTWRERWRAEQGF